MVFYRTADKLTPVEKGPDLYLWRGGSNTFGIEDFWRLRPKMFLNDNLVDLALRQIMAKLPEEKAKSIHLFNSFL